MIAICPCGSACASILYCLSAVGGCCCATGLAASDVRFVNPLPMRTAMSLCDPPTTMSGLNDLREEREPCRLCSAESCGVCEPELPPGAAKDGPVAFLCILSEFWGIKEGETNCWGG